MEEPLRLSARLKPFILIHLACVVCAVDANPEPNVHIACTPPLVRRPALWSGRCAAAISNSKRHRIVKWCSSSIGLGFREFMFVSCSILDSIIVLKFIEKPFPQSSVRKQFANVRCPGIIFNLLRITLIKTSSVSWEINEATSFNFLKSVQRECGNQAFISTMDKIDAW